jgi:hypothetical protein
MIALTETTAFDWITKGQDPPPAQGPESAEWKAYVVGQCIPRVYAAYCKLFHPIHEDTSIRNHDLTWDDDKRANRSPIQSEPGKRAWADLVSNAVLISRNSGIEETREGRVLWRSLAQRYGLVFHPEFNPSSFRKVFKTGSWPRYLFGPAEGTLDRKSCDALICLLKPFSRSQATYFRFSDYLMNDLPHLYRGHLDDLPAFLTKPHFGGTPECWWPEDRSWCVFTDWDLTFTLIGGSQRLVASCLAHPTLECIEVSPDTRIDYRADRLNLPT